MWNPFSKKDSSKLKVKTAKGGGPIRKVKFQIGVSTILFVMSQLGLQSVIPPDLYEPIARFTAEGIAVLIIAVGYWTAPGPDDGISTEVG